jgi:capsular exopolysaccharide synthesis family protein
LQEVAHREHNRQQVRLEQLAAFAADYKEKLTQKQAQFDALAKRAGAGDLFNLVNKQRLVIEQLGAAERELRQSESNPPHQEEERRFQTLLDEYTHKDRILDQLAQRKDELLQAMKAGKRVLVADEQVPFLQKYHRELEIVEERSHARMQEVRSLVEREMGRTRGNLLAMSAGQPQPPGESFKERQNFLRGEIARLQEEARRLNGLQLELERLRREIDQLDVAHQKLAAEAEVVRAESRAADRVTMLEGPTPQPVKDAKRRLLITGLGGLAGFGLGLLGVVWRDSRTRRLRTPEEVIHGLGMPVVGALPRFSARTPPAGVPSGNGVALPPSTLREYTDAVWARLFHAARTKPFRVVMITSALAEEGKTFLTSQLALALAGTGRKTLLLDCDLRRPSAHRHFHLPIEPGFRDVLCGEASIDDAVRPTLYRGLWLLPAGKPKPEPDQALAQEESIRIILEDLKKRYDFILIDSSPILLTADSLWLAQYVDAAIFSLLYDISDFASVRTAYKELSALGTRVLGAVFGRMPARHTRYAYGRGPASRKG